MSPTLYRDQGEREHPPEAESIWERLDRIIKTTKIPHITSYPHNYKEVWTYISHQLPQLPFFIFPIRAFPQTMQEVIKGVPFSISLTDADDREPGRILSLIGGIKRKNALEQVHNNPDRWNIDLQHLPQILLTAWLEQYRPSEIQQAVAYVTREEELFLDPDQWPTATALAETTALFMHWLTTIHDPKILTEKVKQHLSDLYEEIHQLYDEDLDLESKWADFIAGLLIIADITSDSIEQYGKQLSQPPPLVRKLEEWQIITANHKEVDQFIAEALNHTRSSEQFQEFVMSAYEKPPKELPTNNRYPPDKLRINTTTLISKILPALISKKSFRRDSELQRLALHIMLFTANRIQSNRWPAWRRSLETTPNQPSQGYVLLKKARPEQYFDTDFQDIVRDFTSEVTKLLKNQAISPAKVTALTDAYYNNIATPYLIMISLGHTAHFMDQVRDIDPPIVVKYQERLVSLLAETGIGNQLDINAVIKELLMPLLPDSYKILSSSLRQLIRGRGREVAVSLTIISSFWQLIEASEYGITESTSRRLRTAIDEWLTQNSSKWPDGLRSLSDKNHAGPFMRVTRPGGSGRKKRKNQPLIVNPFVASVVDAWTQPGMSASRKAVHFKPTTNLSPVSDHLPPEVIGRLFRLRNRLNRDQQ